MTSVNQIGQIVQGILQKSMDQTVQTITQEAEQIRQAAERSGAHEEKERIISLLESFPMWALSPNLGQDNKREADRAKYEQMVTYKRIYDHCRQKRVSFDEFKVMASRNGIADDHIILMFAAVKFNSERLNAMINDNQAILL